MDILYDRTFTVTQYEPVQTFNFKRTFSRSLCTYSTATGSDVMKGNFYL